MTLNAFKIKEIQNKFIECNSTVTELFFQAHEDTGIGGRRTPDQEELILYCKQLNKFFKYAACDLLYNADNAVPEELENYATALTKFLGDAHPFFEEDKFKRILHIAQTQSVLHPRLRPIYQLLSQVVSALCGIIALCTWYPLNSAYKWCMSDPEPVFKYGIYGTFFSKKSLSEQILENIQHDWEDLNLCINNALNPVIS